MDKNSNYLTKLNDDTFIQYCLQTLAPLISFPFNSEDREIIKSQNPPCNCSKSGCLKLYCECFSKGRYCIGCNCLNCFNVHEYESIRNKSLSHLMHRKAVALSLEKSKIKGCNCKKSNCKKKYCRCHINGRTCNESCRCVDCKNLSHTQISN